MVVGENESHNQIVGEGDRQEESKKKKEIRADGREEMKIEK